MMAKKAGEVNMAAGQMAEGQICWPPGQGVSGQRICSNDSSRSPIGVEPSVAGDCAACGLYRFGKSAADRAEDERRDLALRRQGKIGGAARKFGTVIQFQPCLAEELGGKAHILGAVDSPEPELLLMALEEVERLFELLHGPVK